MRQSINPSFLVLFVLTAVFYLLVVSHLPHHWHPVIKPIPILILILSVMGSELPTNRKLFLSLILFFSFLGDIALTYPGDKMLKAGILFFLIAHCLYIVIFKTLGHFKTSTSLAFLPVMLVLAGLFILLSSHLGPLYAPVIVYMVIIATMVLFAFQVNKARPWIMTGALIFLCSDSILALNLFLYPDSDLRLLTMTTYYLAQLLLTLGLIKALHHTARSEYEFYRYNAA